MNKLKSLKASLFDRIRRFILSDPTKVLVDVAEYTAIKLELSKLKAETVKPINEPATKYELVQKQLGSYIPNLKILADQTDDFKNALGRVCSQAIQSLEFEYLINHVKQDQVNLSLFQERKSEDWVLGSINGIYVLEEQIRLLANGYDDRVRKGLIPSEKKEESNN